MPSELPQTATYGSGTIAQGMAPLGPFVTFEDHQAALERVETELANIEDECKEAQGSEGAAIKRAEAAEQANREFISAFKVWKDATLKRCKLLSSRESSDSMLFPDRAFIERVEELTKGGDDG